MFPLLLIPLVIYNLIAPFGISLTTPIVWVLSFEDLLTTVTLLLLACEIWRSTSPTPETAENHVASLMVLAVGVIEIILVPWCATGSFFLLTVASAVDLTVGTYISFMTKGKNIWVSNK